MNEVFEKFEEIQKTSGTNDKIILLEKLFKEDYKAIDYIRYLFDDTVYGVSKRAIEKALDYDKSFTYSDLGELAFKCSCDSFGNNATIDILDKFLLDVEDLSGNEQIKYLKMFYGSCKKLDAKYFTYLLIHNMHNGLSLKSVNRVLGKIGEPKIEKFEVQLCSKLEPEKFGSLTYPLIAEIKYDGLRIVAEKVGDNVKLTTRQGKDATTYLPEIVNDLKKIAFDFIFDGEVCAKDFSLIQKRIGRKSDNLEPVEGLKYVVFDLLNYIGQDITQFSQIARHNKLNKVFAYFVGHIERTKFRICFNESNLIEYYNEACKNKEEGIIVKPKDLMYDYGSRKNWFKVKPILENTFKAYSFEFGTGRFKDTIGAILVTNGKIYSKVGSGLSDNDREQLHKLLKDKNDLFVDIQYQEITKDKEGNYSLRFPRFLKIRDDKDKADEIDLE